MAERALILSTVCCRAFADEEKRDPEGASDLAKRSYNWLDTLGLVEKLNDWERKILSTEFGKLSRPDLVKATWLIEGLIVLAWALQRADLPAFDQQCDPSEAANSLGFLLPRSQTALASPTLRTPDELEEYNEFIYNLHWRMRDFSFRHQAYDFESLAGDLTAGYKMRVGLHLSDRDLQIDGVPLIQCPEDKWRSLKGLTQERHRASNWLLGYDSEDFYQVATDT